MGSGASGQNYGTEVPLGATLKPNRDLPSYPLLTWEGGWGRVVKAVVLTHRNVCSFIQSYYISITRVLLQDWYQFWIRTGTSPSVGLVHTLRVWNRTGPLPTGKLASINRELFSYPLLTQGVGTGYLLLVSSLFKAELTFHSLLATQSWLGTFPSGFPF